MKLKTNTLYIVSTPIGNLDDITFRATEVLKKSDIILCEDTRHSLKLLNHLKIKKRLFSYHKFNEKKALDKIIEYINEGKILSLISDAGTPLLSDPGQLLVQKCITKNIDIVPIPGASSITAAMSVSGFKDKFLFYGFLPKTNNEIEKILTMINDLKYSLVFFIPAIKINLFLKKFKIYFKDRKILIAKEMTKLHESFYRGNINDIETFPNLVKGELTVIISEKDNKIEEIDENKIINMAKKYLQTYTVKDVVELISKLENTNKKRIYQICLNLKKNEKNN